MKKESRRNFIKKCGAVGAATLAGGGLFGCANNTIDPLSSKENSSATLNKEVSSGSVLEDSTDVLIINDKKFLYSDIVDAKRRIRNKPKSKESLPLTEDWVIGLAGMVGVELDYCSGCEECVLNCPVDVFEMEEGKAYPVNDEECLQCGTCLVVCIEECIWVKGYDEKTSLKK